MNENHLVHIPSCSATNTVPNLFGRFCQRRERFERLEPQELFGRWEKNWQRRKKGGPKSLNLEHGTLNMRVSNEAGLISFERQRRKVPAPYANSASLHGRYPYLAHRNIAASKVEPHVKSAQKIEAEQFIYAACWRQCVAQSLKAAYSFSKRLNTFKGQLRTILNSAPRGDRSPLLKRCRIVANKNCRFPTHQRPGRSSIQSEIHNRIASRAIQLYLNEN
jgi:hypothetical protein